MRKLTLLLVTIAFLAVGTAMADNGNSSPGRNGTVDVLTFEGLQNLEPVNDFYNGGTGGFGSTGGTNFGISFSSSSLALIEDEAGGTGNFAGEPSPSTVLFFLTGDDIMNVAAGFTTGFSFFYTSPFAVGTVNVWSGLNDTGTLLATLTLPTTSTGNCPQDPDAQFCPFVPFGVSFAGTAMSVDFGGSANQIAFDNITLGSSSPGVPEPTTMLLFGTGLAGIATRLRRRKSA